MVFQPTFHCSATVLGGSNLLILPKHIGKCGSTMGKAKQAAVQMCVSLLPPHAHSTAVNLGETVVTEHNSQFSAKI